MKKNLILSMLVMTSLMLMVVSVSGSNSPVEDAIIAGADRLVATQNSDGGWEWKNPDLDKGDVSPENTFGVTAQGLLDAYELTKDNRYLDAAKLAGDHLVSLFTPSIVDNRINAFDIVFLYDLGEISNVPKYTNMANTLLIGTLTQNNFWSVHLGEHCVDDDSGCTAQEMFDAIHARRKGESGIILWDLAPWVKAANLGGQTSWANDLETLMDTEYFILTDASGRYIIGLSGVISATGNSDAVTDLLGKQLADGSWTYVQDTAYAVMALMSVNKIEAVIDGANWLVENQEVSGAWIGSDNVENTEVGSEAVQALFDFGDVEGPIFGETSIEPTYPNCKEESIPVWVYSTITDKSGIQDYPKLKWKIVGVDEYGSPQMNPEGENEYSGIIGITNPINNMEVKYKIEAYDTLGNKGETSHQYEPLFTYDCSAPETTLEIGEPKYENEDTYITSLTEITLECSDLISGCDKTYYRIDDGEFNEVIAPYIFQLTGLADGLHSVEYYSVDNAGNDEILNEPIIVNLDNAEPIVALNELDDFYNSVPIDLVFTYSDSGSGIKEYKVYKKRLGADSGFVDITGIICNTVETTTTCEFEDGNLDGDFEFYVEIIDNVDNSQNSNTVSTTLDRFGPDAVNLENPSNGVYINSQPLLSWLEATDNDGNLNPAGGPYGVSGIKEYELDLYGELIRLNELGYQTSELEEGEHTWKVRAWDNAGNEGTWSETRTFTIDVTLPEILGVNVDPCEGSIYVAGTITASATVADANGVASVSFELGDMECTDIDGTDGWFCEINTISLDDGEYNLVVTALDVAENEEVDNSLVVNVDNTGPTTTVESPPQDSWFSTNFDVVFSYTDAGVGELETCYYSINEGDFEPRTCEPVITIIVGEDGDCNEEGLDTCKIEAYAVDSLGNIGSPVEVSYSIDWTWPAEIMSASPSGKITIDNPTLKIVTNKQAICRYDTQSIAFQDMPEDSMISTDGINHEAYLSDLEDGMHVYYVRCQDEVGNKMLSSETIVFTVDTSENYNLVIDLNSGWSFFFLPRIILETIDSLLGNYSVQNVLSSIEGSYIEIMYRYEDDEGWKSYVPDREVNDLTEFNDTKNSPYWIKMTQSDRLELE